MPKPNPGPNSIITIDQYLPWIYDYYPLHSSSNGRRGDGAPLLRGRYERLLRRLRRQFPAPRALRFPFEEDWSG